MHENRKFVVQMRYGNHENHEMTEQAKSKKCEKKHKLFVKMFAKAGFRYFEALDSPLGPILAPLGPIWSQDGHQKLSENGPKP